MECLQHVLCISCVSELGTEGEVLMCGGCRLWQHRKCAPGVSANFYAQFYVSVLQKEKPQHWLCHYCSKNVTKEPNASEIKQKNGKTPLFVPRNPPPSEDSCDSGNELNMTFDNVRTEREGPAMYPATSLSSLEDRALPSLVKILIPPRPALLDPSRLPITYALCQERNGQKKVKDCHGNVFKTTGVITDKAEAYRCTHLDCKFQVRVREDIEEFLCGGHFNKEAHNHNMKPTYKSDTSDSDEDSDGTEHEAEISITPSLPTPGTTPFHTPVRKTRVSVQKNISRRGQDSDSSDSSDSSDDDCPSPILPPFPAAPVNTPARDNRVAKRWLQQSDSDCSDTTSGSDIGHMQPPAIQRFEPLTTPIINKSSADFSFSSSDDSTDNLDIAMICGRHDDNTNNPSDTVDNDMPPPPPATLPACSSSDSSDSEDEPEGTTITYTITDGTASGNQARLTDSHGYTYQIKFKLGMRVFWTCTEKVGRCSATIIQQRKNQFTRGAASHNHKRGQSESIQKERNPPALPAGNKKATSEPSLKQPSYNTAVRQSEGKRKACSKTPQKMVEIQDITMDKVLPVGNLSTVHQSKRAKIFRPGAIVYPIKPNTKTTAEKVKSSLSAHLATSSTRTASEVLSQEVHQDKSMDKVLPVGNSSTVHQSKRAKIFNFKAGAFVKAINPNTKTTAEEVKSSLSAQLATCTSSEVLCQEVTTCTFYYFRPQSIVIDSDGYIYRTKHEPRPVDVTVWKCNHKGPNGSCRGRVHFEYTSQRNCYGKFIWNVHHSKPSKIVPHNHAADKTAAVTIKLRAMFHQQVYGYGNHNSSAKFILLQATACLYSWEKSYVPTTRQQTNSLNRFIWKLQKRYRDEPRIELHRYMIE